MVLYLAAALRQTYEGQNAVGAKRDFPFVVSRIMRNFAANRRRMAVGERLSKVVARPVFASITHTIMAGQVTTESLFRDTMEECRSLFEKKLHDYGASWRIMRPSSLTDQLLIKAKRIRSLETKKASWVGEGIRPEFIALINYGIIGLIQLEKGFADTVDMTAEEAAALYRTHAEVALQLMLKKNHDHDEAWRVMRVSSYTDLILTKIQRVKEMEDLHEETLVSEGIDANYLDIINYAVFGAIQLKEEEGR